MRRPDRSLRCLLVPGTWSYLIPSSALGVLQSMLTPSPLLSPQSQATPPAAGHSSLFVFLQLAEQLVVWGFPSGEFISKLQPGPVWVSRLEQAIGRWR